MKVVVVFILRNSIKSIVNVHLQSIGVGQVCYGKAIYEGSFLDFLVAKRMNIGGKNAEINQEEVRDITIEDRTTKDIKLENKEIKGRDYCKGTENGIYAKGCTLSSSYVYFVDANGKNVKSKN